MESYTQEGGKGRKVGNYREGQRCPACSAERDRGGRLVAHKKKHWYLNCAVCKYSIIKSKVEDWAATNARKIRDKDLFKTPRKRRRAGQLRKAQQPNI